MDFIDELKVLSKRVANLKEHITTEEATKTSLVLPFFQLLGYDVFNPLEFVPEFSADVGTKKGEKVDYAICDGGNPIVFIECKWSGTALEKHDSQLFRYFGANQKAKFAILTNGIIYRFYTDLDNPNVMDLSPFLELNMLDIKDATVSEVKKFHKSTFDADRMLDTASELRYTNLIKKFLAKQTVEPDESFVKYILGEIYEGRRNESVVERFRDIVRKSFNFYVSDVLNEKLKSVMQDNTEAGPGNPEGETPENADSKKETAQKIVTTAEEIEAAAMIKSMISEVIEPSRVSMKDFSSYATIQIDESYSKWICRLRVDRTKKSFSLWKPRSEKEQPIYIESINDLLSYKIEFISVTEKLLGKDIQKQEQRA